MRTLTRTWILQAISTALLMAVAAWLVISLMTAIVTVTPITQLLLPRGTAVLQAACQVGGIFIVALLALLWMGLTDRRRSEPALPLAALEGLLLAAPSGVILTDRRYHIRELNPVAAKMFGVGPSIFGRQLDELFQSRENIADGETIPVDPSPVQRTARSADGERFPVLVSSVSLGKRDDDLIAIFVDQLTDELTLAKSQRHAERQFQALFNGIPDGVFRSLPDGTLVSANPALIEMLGGDPAAGLADRKDTRGFYVDPKNRRDLITELVRSGVVRNAVLSLQRCDGETIRVLANVRAVRDPDNRPILFEGTLTDLTGFEIKPSAESD